MLKCVSSQIEAFKVNYDPVVQLFCTWFEKLATLTFSRSIWRHITKPDGGGGDKAEVKSIKEGPVLPDGEKNGPRSKEDTQGTKSAHQGQNAGLKTTAGGGWTVFIFFFPVIFLKWNIISFWLPVYLFFMMCSFSATMVTLFLLLSQASSSPPAMSPPTSAKTESMRGIPIIPNRRQKSLPPKVSVAKFP